MTAKLFQFPAMDDDSDLLAALGIELDSDLYLKPGETIADRIPAKIAKGREVEAARRRANFRTV
jgi:hypothetical protein